MNVGAVIATQSSNAQQSGELASLNGRPMSSPQPKSMVSVATLTGRVTFNTFEYANFPTFGVVPLSVNSSVIKFPAMSHPSTTTLPVWSALATTVKLRA